MPEVEAFDLVAEETVCSRRTLRLLYNGSVVKVLRYRLLHVLLDGLTWQALPKSHRPWRRVGGG